MLNVGDLISKKLIVLNSAESIGTVKDVIFDDRLTRVKLLEIYDDSGTDSEIKFVGTNKIKNFGADSETPDACVIADKSAVLSEWAANAKRRNNPINKECYNQDGACFGRVLDVVLSGATVEKIIAEKTEFTPDKILSHSDRLVIINDTGKPIKLYKPKRTVVPAPQSSAERKVTVHGTAGGETPLPVRPQSTATATAQPAATNQSDAAVKLPARVPPENTLVTRTPVQDDSAPSPYKFLIGKTLTKDIAADNGVIILRKHAIINDEVIASARDHGKLVQLALHAE